MSENELSNDNPEPTENETASEQAPTSNGGSKVRQQTPTPEIFKELNRLMELSTKYPEIGPLVAEVALKTGYPDISNQILSMGLNNAELSIEYHFVAARLARREGRHTDALAFVAKALKRCAANLEEIATDEIARLPHLIRLGFSVLLFELGGPEALPEFTDALVEYLPQVSARFEGDPLYYTLLAQVLWYKDRVQSEKTWDHAVSLGDAEMVWNARGTWYKEVDGALFRAESTYRQGLQDNSDSELLLHNLAQVLVDRAEDEDAELEERYNWLGESEKLLRRALRMSSRPRFRRYLHETFDRLKSIRGELPRLEKAPPTPPKVGDVVKGCVRSITTYGAFLDIGNGHRGLLHKSAMSHEQVGDPAHLMKNGDEIDVQIIEVRPRDNGKGLRIGLSRKALLPAPNHPQRGRHHGNRRQDARSPQTSASMGTFGDILKLQQQAQERSEE